MARPPERPTRGAPGFPAAGRACGRVSEVTAIRLHLRSPRVDADLGHGEDEHYHEQRPGDGRGIAHMEELEALLVHVVDDRRGGAQWPAAGHDRDLRERLER